MQTPNCHRPRSPWLLWLWIAASLLPFPLMAAEPLQIYASVLPQKHFIEQVGGNQVEAHALVQPGFSPETFEPTARQIAKLAIADAYVRIGMPFEDAWMPRIQGINPDMLVLDARKGLQLLEMAAHSHEGEAEGHAGAHDHADDGHTDGRPAARHELDPHIWTSPRNVKQMAVQIRDTLAKLRPEQTAYFDGNLQQFTAKLDALDKELTRLFAEHPQAKFMVFHPAWGYLAEAYHLTQIPIEAEGKEPGAKALTALIGQAKAEQVKVVFTQPQFDQRAAKQVAKAIGGQVVAIDPLAEDYIANLRNTARLIAGVADE